MLSLPHELRVLAAFKPDVLSALGRFFVATHRARARASGLGSGAECGAVTFVQRFGGSLNLNVHFHTVVLDGVLTRDGNGHVHFHPAPEPTPNELLAIVERVHRRALRWLHRKGYLDERGLEDRSNEAEEVGALEACGALAMHRGTFAKLTAGECPPTTITRAPR